METEVIDRLREDFQDPEYRHVYSDGFLDSSIATQIKVLREDRHWTQKDLADKAKMAQSRISEIEDVNYSSWSIRTLRRLAKAFDLRLVVSFEEFGSLLSDYTKLSRKHLKRRSFSDDFAFNRAQSATPRKKASAAESLGIPQQQNLFGEATRSYNPELVIPEDTTQDVRGINELGGTTDRTAMPREPQIEPVTSSALAEIERTKQKAVVVRIDTSARYKRKYGKYHRLAGYYRHKRGAR